MYLQDNPHNTPRTLCFKEKNSILKQSQYVVFQHYPIVRLKSHISQSI